MKRLLILLLFLPFAAHSQNWLPGGAPQALYGAGYTNLRFSFGAHPLVYVYTQPSMDSLLALKANLLSPHFLGTPLTPTQSVADSSQQIINSQWFYMWLQAHPLYFNTLEFFGNGKTPLTAISLLHGSVGIDTVNNGLTLTSHTLQFGGALIKNTTVNTGTYNLYFNSGTGTSIYMQPSVLNLNLDAYTAVQLSSGSVGLQAGVSGSQGFLNLSSSIASLQFATSATNSLTLSATSSAFTDALLSRGLKYTADYHVNGVANYGARWIPDKGYNDATYAVAGSYLTLGTPNQTVTQVPIFANSINLNGQNLTTVGQVQASSQILAYSTSATNYTALEHGGFVNMRPTDLTTEYGGVANADLRNDGTVYNGHYSYTTTGSLTSEVVSGFQNIVFMTGANRAGGGKEKLRIFDDGHLEGGAYYQPFYDANSYVQKRYADSLSTAGGGTLTYSHIAGYGLSGSNFNNSANVTWTADSTSIHGLVSKDRLTTNLGGYYKALVPTAVKTANYTAAVSDFVPCDNTSGSFTITLPTAPVDKALIAVKTVVQSGANTITISTGGTDVFNVAGGSATLTLKLLFQAVLLQYKSSTGIWYVLADDITLGSLDARYSASGAISALTGDATATGPGSVALTLATVNSNVGTFGSSTSIPTFTVNGKGLITSASGNAVIAPAGTLTGTTLASNVVTSSLTTASLANLTATDGTLVFSGAYNGNTARTVGIASSVALAGSPTTTTQTVGDNSTKIATTAYVDASVLGQDFKEASKYATTAALPSIVYNNGSSGVGATLTGVGFGAITIDGSTPSIGDRILVKNQVSTFQNGIYTVTIVGTVSTVFVLTRANDFNQSTEIKTGSSTFVTSGTANSATTWAVNSADNPVMGTDAITFAQVAGQGSFTGGNGITITGTSIAINTAVTVDKTTAQTLTNKDISSTTNTYAALTSSAFANQGTTTQLLHGNGSGNLSFGQLVNADITNSTIDVTTKITGAVPIANAGTNITTYTTGDILYASATNVLSKLSIGGANTVLHGGTTPSYSSVANADLANSTISGIALGNNLNNLTVNNGGSGDASSFTYNGGTAHTISYNSIGAEPTITFSTTNNGGASTLSGAGALNIPNYTDNALLGLQALGSTVKGLPVGAGLGNNQTLTMANQTEYFTPVYLPVGATLTGVVANLSTLGNYTGNNYNGAGLYTYSGGSITLVASSTTSNTTWSTQNSNILIPFSSTYVATAGVYYIGILYCESAQTTAPVTASYAAQGTTIGATGLLGGTNKLFGNLTGKTALVTGPQATSGFVSTGAAPYVFLY